MGFGVQNRSGQALTEYMLMLFVVMLLFGALIRFLSSADLPGKLLKPVQEDYKRAYRYGHIKTKGPEDGGPYWHVRIVEGENFRIFVNPSPQ
jgi:hypothetical protein